MFNIFLLLIMFEIFLVSSRDTSHSQFGIQNQILGIPRISGYCKFQTVGGVRVQMWGGDEVHIGEQ